MSRLFNQTGYNGWNRHSGSITGNFRHQIKNVLSPSRVQTNSDCQSLGIIHYYPTLSDSCFAGAYRLLITLWNCMFPSDIMYISSLIQGQKLIYLNPKPDVTTYLICCISVICSFPERLHSGNQTVICNIAVPVCISLPNLLGSKYVQQIAFGNINKDCHCGLHLQCRQTGKKHTFSLCAPYCICRTWIVCRHCVGYTTASNLLPRIVALTLMGFSYNLMLFHSVPSP